MISLSSLSQMDRASSTRIWLCTGPADMQRGFDRLAEHAQSSTYQVMHNLESQRLQYAMREQLTAMGWPAVDIVDEDLGKSAGGNQERLDFRRMVAEVSLAQAGIIAARKLSRCARNSRDWQHLIGVCRIVGTLLMDEEAIYDARQSNDRLLLGLKGSMSEYELDLLRQRWQKARQRKALRAELGMNAPVGYVNVGEGRQEKDPDQRVQQAVLARIILTRLQSHPANRIHELIPREWKDRFSPQTSPATPAAA
jgi:DNA invertase Pin-like site-specific DNA recombinase